MIIKIKKTRVFYGKRLIKCVSIPKIGIHKSTTF